MEYKDYTLVGVGTLAALILIVLVLLYLKRDKEVDDKVEEAPKNVVLADIHLPAEAAPLEDAVEISIPAQPPIIVVTQPPSPEPQDLFTK